jgi:Tfp pilus assembly protein PilE
MIVVVIISILATIGGVAYRRYVARARSTEAVSMIAEMVSKEQVYFTEFAQYLPLRTDNAAVTASGGTATETGANFYPVNLSTATGTTFNSARFATAVGVMPTSWAAVGVRPRDRSLYCTYQANAGLVNSATAAAPSFGAAMLGAAALTVPWFYVLGSCNMNGESSFPGGVTSFGMSSNWPNLTTFNEGQ